MDEKVQEQGGVDKTGAEPTEPKLGPTPPLSEEENNLGTLLTKILVFETAHNELDFLIAKLVQRQARYHQQILVAKEQLELMKAGQMSLLKEDTKTN